MARVYLSFDDLGLGIQLADTLEGAGYLVDWSRQPADAPPEQLAAVPDAVVLGGVDNAHRLGTWIDAWRRLEPPPATLVVGAGEAIAKAAGQHRAIFLPSSLERQALIARIEHGLALRYTAQLSPRYARGALGLPVLEDPHTEAKAIVVRARQLDIAIVREALRPCIYDYASCTPALATLRDAGVFTSAESSLIAALDGTITVGRATALGALDPVGAGRLAWALACVGAVQLTPDPPDLATPERRALAYARHHLQERASRLTRGRATYYDVLDVSYPPSREEITGATRRLGLRFSPRRLAHMDLADLASSVAPLWDQIEKADQTLSDPQHRAHYDRYLASHGVDLLALERDRSIDVPGAEADFARGQRALTDSKLHQAVSLFASAARRYPGHLDYEAYLAWARYRSALDRGADKAQAARTERTNVERLMAGRAPRARALLALGLLCAASQDPAAARWHLNEALTVDPDLGQARQILQRLG